MFDQSRLHNDRIATLQHEHNDIREKLTFSLFFISMITLRRKRWYVAMSLCCEVGFICELKALKRFY